MRQVLKRRRTRQARRKRVGLPDGANAAIGAGMVCLSLVAAQRFGLAAEAGYLVITMQSIASVNRRASLGGRLEAAAVAAGLQVLAAGLGVICQGQQGLSVAVVMAMALSFGYLRQAYPDKGASITIPAGVVFFLAVSDHRRWEPLAAVAGGGAFALLLELTVSLAIAYFYTRLGRPQGLSRNVEPALTPVTEPSALGLKATYLTYGLELAAGLAAGQALVPHLGALHPYWLLFTVMVVLQETHDTTLQRVIERLAGTAAGCLVGSAILLTHPTPGWQLVLTTGCMFGFLLQAGKRYGVASAFITVFVLVLLGARGQNPVLLAGERLGLTVIGAALGLVISLIGLVLRERWAARQA